MASDGSGTKKHRKTESSLCICESQVGHHVIRLSPTSSSIHLVSTGITRSSVPKTSYSKRGEPVLIPDTALKYRLRGHT